MNFQRDFFSSLRVILIAAFIFSLNSIAALQINAADPSYRMDFDGDGKTDIAVFRPGQRDVFPFPPSYFYILGSQSGQLISQQWGRAYDIHTPADYDNDGKTDVAVFRWLENDLTATASDFWIKYSLGGHHTATRFSGFGNIVSRNYFDDGRAEIAVFDRYDASEDPTNPCFIWAFSIKPGGSDFGLRKDVINSCLPAQSYLTPAVGDYNNDGKSDAAILVQSLNQPSSQNQFRIWFSPVSPIYTPPDSIQTFDIDYPIPGDYDGDGKTDLAGSRNVDGVRLWRVKYSNSNQTFELYFGFNSDYPVPGDYDGDGKTDIAVFRPSNGMWYIRRSSDIALIQIAFGLSTDIPLTMPNSNIYH